METDSFILINDRQQDKWRDKCMLGKRYFLILNLP